MSEPEPLSPLAGRLLPGRFGAASDAPVRIGQRSVALVQLAARRDRADALAVTVAEALQLRLPPAGRSSGNGDLAAMWLQPGAWLVCASQTSEGMLARMLAEAAAGLASVVDQTHGRLMIALTGAASPAVLSRICRIDLHPRSFPAGQVAATPVADLPCLLHRPTDATTFEIVVAATFAAAFLHRLTDAAAGFGYEIG